MKAWLRQLAARSELVDILVGGFHIVALAVLAPHLTEFAHWPTILAQSLGLIVVCVVTAGFIDVRNKNAALSLRALTVLLSSIWGYERVNEIIQVYWGSPAIEGWFIDADQAIFGGQASMWAQSVHHPLLTEWLQFAYMTYFFLPLVVALFLMFQRRWHHLPLLTFAVVLATHQNFIWYVLVPVRSPFLIVETGEAAGTVLSYDFELYGLWFAETLRENLLAASTMRHDCFPSGHTCMSVTTMVWAWRMSKPSFWVIAPFGFSIVFSTIYLRYHYLIDIVAGLVMAALIVWAAPRLVAMWQARRDRLIP